MLSAKQNAMRERHERVRRTAFVQKTEHHWRPNERDLAVMLSLQLKFGESKNDVIRRALYRLAEIEGVK